MPLCYAHLWQNQDHSDVDVALTVVEHTEDADQQQHSTQLARFPGHSALLSCSPMISAQILRWQHQDTASEGPPAKRRCTRSSTAADNHSTSNTDDSSSRPQLVLELQDASEEAAALTVLQSLYAVEPLGQLLAKLRQEQLLQAAMLADKWQVPDVATAAVSAVPSDRLSRDVLQQFVQLPALPTFLLPLLGPVSKACVSNSGAGAGMAKDAKRLLLSVLGDLEAVLGDAALMTALLALPPATFRRLLSYDDLKVASEDTVLTAAREYVKAHPPSATDLVIQALGFYIRCQHLSTYWLSACVLSDDKHLSTLVSPFKNQLQKLLLMRLADKDYVPTIDELQEHFQGAPESWKLGQRAARQVNSVQVVWLLPINELRTAAQRAAAEKELVDIECPAVSAPLGGMTWSMSVEADWDADKKATQLGLFCVPRNAPHKWWYKFRAHCEVQGAPALSRTVRCPRVITGEGGKGWGDFFQAGWMSGGWDEEAWVAAGLPAEGELRVTFTVTAFNFADDSDTGSG